MINVSSAELEALLAFMIWPMTRLLGFFLMDPFYSSRNIPRRWKIAFVLWLTFLIAPLIPPIPSIPLASAKGFLIVAQQLLIGLAMGAFLRFLMAAAELSGVLMGMQMGLGFALFFDPQHAAAIPLPSRVMSVFFMLLFLALDGHLIVLRLLVESFEAIPIGERLTLDHIGMVLQWSAKVFYWALRLAMPMLAALLITNMAMGIMTRSAPQFNIFSFGFPLTLSVGFVIFYYSIPFMADAAEGLFEETYLEMQKFMFYSSSASRP